LLKWSSVFTEAKKVVTTKYDSDAVRFGHTNASQLLATKDDRFVQAANQLLTTATVEIQ